MRASNHPAIRTREGFDDQRLTEELAARVLGWRLAPGRYIKSGRCWIPRWRFQPLVELDDAFKLLDGAAHFYILKSDRSGAFSAEVSVGRNTGKASGKSKARTITLALAHALGLEVD